MNTPPPSTDWPLYLAGKCTHIPTAITEHASAAGRRRQTHEPPDESSGEKNK